ncbi:hypothetical protein M9Y10_003018 [Tritrichomonas musculus]|uniref:Protein kinase domain-containing protein n=1 Tax=Tritrichomonas musculus TaxID=1915356 RepID=A0ABR2JNQ1_9EUKA
MSIEQLHKDIIQRINISIEEWHLDITKFKKQALIKKTHKSTFYMIQEKETNNVYIAKIFNQDMNVYSKYIKINLPRTLKIISSLDHLSILKFKGFVPVNFQNKPNLVLVSEFCPNGKLSDLLKNVRKNTGDISNFTSTKKLINIYGIASAMRYLHSKNIIHQKLQSNTIFLDESYYPKLSNYFYKQQESAEPFEIYISPSNAAPEVLTRKEYSKASDVYAFAMIVYEIIANKKPFKSKNANRIMNEVVNKKNRPKTTNLIPECYRKLLKSCWSNNPSKRPTFSEIVYELRHNSKFLADDIDRSEFYRYVDLLNPSEKSSDSLDELIKPNVQIERSFEPQVDCCIDLNNYTLLKKIGDGGFADVYKVKDKETSEIFAAKVFLHNIEDTSEVEKIQLKREIEIMNRMNHPSIIKIIGYSKYDFKGEEKPTIIMEFAKNDSLSRLLEMERSGLSPQGWNSTAKMITMYGIASGMAYMHSLDIIHRDLKPDNILEDQFLHPKICDFGLSKELNGKNNSVRDLKGTPAYMAPEIISNDLYSKAGDVYAFAFIIYELLSVNEQPYKKMNVFQLFNAISKCERPVINSDIPEFYRELISKCWAQDMNERPSFKEIALKLKSEDALLELVDEEDFLDYVEYIDEYFHIESDIVNEDDQNDDNDSKADDKVDKTDDKVDKKSKQPKKFKVVDVDYSLLKQVKDLVISQSIQPIDLDQFIEIDELGSGGFADVSKIQKKGTEEFYAAKILRKEITRLSKEELISFSREVNILSKINYLPIIKFIGYSRVNFEKDEQPVIISELAVNGSLRDILDMEMKGCGAEGWNDTKKFINIYGIACAMKFLHSHSILHRDLKPDNVLLDNYLYPKLTDFGLSRAFDPLKVTEHNSNVLGTAPYVSPEVWNWCDHSESSDVYAFAFLVFEMITGTYPFQGFEFYQIFTLVGKQKYRPPFKYQIPDCYRNLIESCWSEEAFLRPSFDDIVNELKTNPEFVSENVDIDELILYSESIDEIYTDLNPERNAKPKPQDKQLIQISVPHSKQKISEITITQFTKIIETEKEDQSFKDFCINLNDYEQKEILKKEELSVVYKVVNKETGKKYAARVSNIDMNQFTNDEMREIAHEMNLISQIKHRAILEFVGFSPSSFKNESKPVIITEKLKTKTLYETLKLNKELDATKKLIIIYGIASGMKCLHSYNIVHRNLKPRNVLLTKDFHPKLNDFGLCTHLLVLNSMTFQATSEFNGSPIYSAPEVLSSKGCSQASDVYSFALITYEIMCENKPFENLRTFTEIYNEVVNCNNRPEIPSSVPDCYRKLIEICWSQDPDERLTFEEIVNVLNNDKNFITPEVDSEVFNKYVRRFDSDKPKKHKHKKYAHS